VAKKRASGLIPELENVLPFLKELNVLEQEVAAFYLGTAVRLSEERRTMSKAQVVTLHALQRAAWQQEHKERMKEIRRMIRRLGE
jgi:hypothetical protein